MFRNRLAFGLPSKCPKPKTSGRLNLFHSETPKWARAVRLETQREHSSALSVLREEGLSKVSALMRGNCRHGVGKAAMIKRLGQHRRSRYLFVDALDGVAVRISG